MAIEHSFGSLVGFLDEVLLDLGGILVGFRVGAFGGNFVRAHFGGCQIPVGIVPIAHYPRWCVSYWYEFHEIVSTS